MAVARHSCFASATHGLRTPWGEWPRGVSPLGSRRTGREPLSSPGSHCPAVGPHDPPVGKQLRLASGDAHQPPSCSPAVTAQPLVLPLGPANKVLVDAPEKRTQLGLVEAPVIVDPPLHDF